MLAAAEAAEDDPAFAADRVGAEAERPVRRHPEGVGRRVTARACAS